MSVTARAVTTAVLAVVLAVGAFVGPVTLAVVSAAVAALVVYGWPTLLNLPSVDGSRIVLAVAAAGAVAVGATAGRFGIAGLPFVVAIGVFGAFVAEMLRRDGRHRVVESLCGVVAGVVSVACVAGWSAAALSPGGQALVVTAAACIAAASAVSAALPWQGWWIAGVSVAAAGLVGAGLAALLANIGVAEGVWAGLVVGVLVASLTVLFDRVPHAARRSGALALSALPVLLGGMLTYVVGTVVG